MDAKDFFQQIRHVDKQINMKYEQLEQLKALAIKVTANISESSARVSGPARGMENTIEKIIALQEELNTDIDRYVNLKRAANEIVRQIRNEKYRYILVNRYLLDKTWETIAAELQMTYQGVCHVHGKALQEAEKFLEKDGKFDSI